MKYEFSHVEIVEFSFHNGAVGQLVFAMSAIEHSGIHIRWLSQSNHSEEIPLEGTRFTPFVSNATKSRLLGTLLFYLKVLSRIQCRKYIWVSTGPESKVVPDLLFFLFLWFFWKKKMILSVRNIERWGCSFRNETRQDKVRGWIISKIPRLVFESEIQRRLFHRCHSNYEGLTSSFPVFFSDGMGFWGNFGGENSRDELEIPDLRIGLLGGVDLERRDYGEVVAALSELESNLRERIVLSILGSSSSSVSSKLIAELRSLVRVETFGSYISNKVLMRELSKSDVLLAPLRTDLGYGSYKGTGSLGDALIAQCKVLMPSAIPVDQELLPAVIPYRSASDLTSQLQQLVDTPQKQRIDIDTLAFYSREQAFDRVRRDLALD